MPNEVKRYLPIKTPSPCPTSMEIIFSPKLDILKRVIHKELKSEIERYIKYNNEQRIKEKTI